MDDFLHNLRSGKLKQVDRSNRPYNDQQFKGGQRRNLDRRNKGHFENKDSSERLNAIKEVLEALVENQKQMAEAYQARTQAEERKARAMEVIAKNLYRMLNPNATDADDVFASSEPQTSFRPNVEPSGRNVEPSGHTATANVSDFRPNLYEDEEEEEDAAEALADEAGRAEEANASDAEESEEAAVEDETESTGMVRASSGRLTGEERHKLFRLIDRLRTDGLGWEKIARHLTAQGHPTISGKGTWRGIMVKNLHEKMANS
jgi:hypothetical protein